MRASGLRYRAALALTSALAVCACSVDTRELTLAVESNGGESSVPAAGGAPSEPEGGAPSEPEGGAEMAVAGAPPEPARCGNGILDANEGCDDGGDAERDGCNVACEVEDGYDCAGEPSSCRRCEGKAGERRCAVAGGAFERGPEGTRSLAAVSSFSVDELEITVRRFRQFVTEYEGAPPPGAGRHPEIPDSGWRQEWGVSLPEDRAALIETLHCGEQWQTWTDEAAEREDFPINCLSYYVAFAYCASRGGRLPTEAEWEYLASGGAQQRTYPWGEDLPSPDLASFGSTQIGAAGAHTAGHSRFGPLDLAGSVWEWSLDWLTPYPATCDRCAELSNGFERVLRGGYFLGGAEYLRASYRFSSDPALSLGNVGARCAYDPLSQ